jgi:hypothetical protein
MSIKLTARFFLFTPPPYGFSRCYYSHSWGSLLPLSTMVPLSGSLTLKAGSMVATTTSDLRSEVFRNDIVIIVGPTAAPAAAAAAAAATSSSSSSSSSSAAAAAPPKQAWSARCFRVHSGAIRGSLKLLLARARKEAAETAAAAAAARRAAGGDSQQDDEDGDEFEDDEDGDEDEEDAEGEEEDDDEEEAPASTSGAAASTSSSGALMSQPPGGTMSSSLSSGSSAAAPSRKRGRPPGSGKAARLAALAAQAVADGNVEAAAAVEMERRQWESDRAAASVLAEHGILTVSVGNAVMNSGGHFSAGDTAPHVLRSTALGYAQPFTATALPLDRPWDGSSGSGYRAFKFGLTADMRVLWRETVAPGSLAKLAAYASGTSAAAAASTSTAAAADGGDDSAADGGSGAGAGGGGGGPRRAPPRRRGLSHYAAPDTVWLGRRAVQRAVVARRVWRVRRRAAAQRRRRRRLRVLLVALLPGGPPRAAYRAGQTGPGPRVPHGARHAGGGAWRAAHRRGRQGGPRHQAPPARPPRL